ncbi:MAG: redox-sensing transcriptional repressor Rex, partial [Clostridiales bacterium]
MAEDNKNLPVISKQTLQRLPYYLHYLKSSTEKGRENISARLIADELRLNEIQVRKDLASVSKSGGKPKTGFLIKSLIEDIEEFLGYNNIDGVVLVGAGQLGRTLLSYRGFDNYGINIEAAFDVDETLIGL